MVGVSQLYVPGDLDGNAQKQYTGFVMFRNADKTLSAIEYSPTTEQHVYMPSFRNSQLSGTYRMYTTDNYETLRVSPFTGEKSYDIPVWASNLTSISKFGSKITRIGDECFKGTSLTSIEFGSQISAVCFYKLFFKCHKLQSVTFANGAISSTTGIQTEKTTHTFTDCSSLTAVNLEALSCCQDGLDLGDYMFRNCTALSTLDLRCFSSLDFTNDTNHEPFKGCKNLRKIYFDYQHFMRFSIDKTSHTHMLAGVTASNAVKMSIYLTDVPDTIDADTFENGTKPKFQFLTDFYKKQNINIIGVKPNGSVLTSYHLKGS